MARTLLEINDLHTHFPTKDGVVKAVNGVSLQLEENSILGLVGESGSGKTVTALSVLRLLPYPGETVRGRVWYQNRDLLRLEAEEMRRIRGQEIALVFQDAGSSLNPVITIGRQVEETVLAHTDMGRREATARAVELLTEMGIPDAKRTLGRYPFQLKRRDGAARHAGDGRRSPAEGADSGRADVEPGRHPAGRDTPEAQGSSGTRGIRRSCSSPTIWE